MPFRVPGAGVLGPRPGQPAHQAYYTGPPPSLPPAPPAPPTAGIPDVWNQQVLLAALATANVPPSGPQTAEWYLDTGASSHMASNAGILTSPQPLSGSPPITVGNGATLPVTHRAHTLIPTTRSPLLLDNVLVSVRSLTRDNNVTVEFDPLGFSVKDLHTRMEILRCNSHGELYLLAPSSPAAFFTSAPSADLWHQRLGHPGRHAFSKTLSHLDFVSTKSLSTTCEVCQMGKHVRLPFSSSNSVSLVPFQIVHADVWTSPVVSCSGFKYYLVLVDDFTHYVWTFPLRAKSEVLQCLLHFHAYTRTQFQLPLIAFQTDNGKEFDNHGLRTHLANHGVNLRLSCPYTSSQNGKAKRIIRTLNDCIHSLLLHAAMPDKFWVEALATATHLLNRRPCQTSGAVTPFQLLLGCPPSYAHLRVFGCLCYPNQSSTAAHKLSPRSTPCVLLGYPTDHRGYRCLDLHSRRVITSRHVIFDETQFPFRSGESETTATTTLLPTVPNSPVVIQHIQPSPPQPSPPRNPPAIPDQPLASPSPGTVSPADGHSSAPSHATADAPPAPPASSGALVVYPMTTRSRAGIFKPNPRYALSSETPSTPTAEISPIPKSARAALKDPNWRAAMAREFDALQHSRTWRLVDRPPQSNIVTGKWVFKHKLNPDGTLERYKARWVVRGFTQRAGVDFGETFTPVVKPATI